MIGPMRKLLVEKKEGLKSKIRIDKSIHAKIPMKEIALLRITKIHP